MQDVYYVLSLAQSRSDYRSAEAFLPSATEDLASSEAALAHEISLARRQRRTISGRRGVLDLDAAYRIQRQRFEGLAVVGAKIGMVGPVKLDHSQLVHAPVVREMLLEESAVDLGAFIQARLEPELAAVLSADISSDSPPGDVARALTGLFLAVDIVDTVWEAYDFEPPESVADGVNGGAFLLGEQLLPPDVSGELRLCVNGDIVGAGSVADLGDPVTRISWLAAELNGLRSGDVVFLGSPAANVSATPGTLLLEGPHGATLSADLRGEA